MTGPGYLLLLIIVLFLFAVVWRINRAILPADPADGPTNPGEADVLASEVTAAERLWREADAATDPEEKASLVRLAKEADEDVDKLKRDLDQQHGRN